MTAIDNDNVPMGWSDNAKPSYINKEMATLQRIGRRRAGSEVVATNGGVWVADDLAEAGSTSNVINATAHLALAGDIIVFGASAANPKTAVFVDSVATNTITLAQVMGNTIATNNPFTILRPTHARFGELQQSFVSIVPDASGAATDSVFHLISAATNNATSIKGTPGVVTGYEIYNNSAATKFVKLYNKASAPNPASDTPVITIGLAANSPARLTLPHGRYFSTGIALAAVTGISDTDNTAVALSDLAIQIFYK